MTTELPEHVQHLLNNAFAYQQNNQHIDAVLRFDEAIDLMPELYNQYVAHRFYSVWNGFKQSQDSSDWRHYDRLQKLLLEASTLGLWTVGEMTLAAPLLSNLDLLNFTSHHATFTLKKVANHTPFDFTARGNTGKIKIGFVGADFYEQATAYLLTEAVAHIDRAQFEVYAYDLDPKEIDSLRSRSLAAYDYIRPVHEMSDDAAAQCIYDDGIDVLFSIKNPASTRLGIFALRPAPIQVHYLYFPGTSGMPFFDAFVADDVVVPPELEYGYAEKIWRIKGCYQPNDTKRHLPLERTKAEWGLPEDAVVMANMSQNYKITPYVFEQWMRVMRIHPNVVLWLLSDDPDIQQRLRSTAQQRGVNPSRLYFSVTTSTIQHLTRLRSADFVVDTFPYGGHTLTSDALWAGTPVVALMGETYASRVAASLLTNVGLPELINHSYDGYLRCINGLINDEPRRRAYRQHLTDNRHNFDVFNSQSYAQRFGDMIKHYIGRA